jgi:hypothetical protein
MSFADLSRTVLRVQYQITRIPLQLVEEQLVARLDSDARLRLFYERSLEALDAVAGTVLDSPRLAQRGATKIERSEKLMRAADLDAVANATVAQANAELKDARGAATQAVEDAQAEKAREAKQAQDSAEERKRAARETSDQRADAAKSRPMRRLPSARVRRTLPSEWSTPSFGPARSSPRSTRRPSSMRRRTTAASPHANAPTRIG